VSLTLALSDTLIYAGAGVIAGLISGLMGIGGGIIVVPTLVFLFQHNSAIPHDLIMPLAIGSSLAVMVFTAQASLRIHFQMNNIFWGMYKHLAPGIILGTICGALLADKLPTQWLKALFCLFLLSIALKMIVDLKYKPKPAPRRFPKRWTGQLMSFFIGCQSGLLGIGGGTMVVPYLSYCGLELRKITPISMLCTTTVAVIGTVAFMIIGSFQTNLPAFSIGFIYWPAVFGIAITSIIFAPFGAKLTYILSAKHLKYCFIFFLIAMVIELQMVHSP
jgi:uncharacterized membrane protein YfcA